MGGKDDLLTCYVAHRRDLLNYAIGITRDRVHAEDLVQEAWVRCHSEQPEQPLSFLYRIIRNLAVDRYRHLSREKKRFVQADDAFAASIPAGSPDAEAELSGREELQIMMAALSGLPEKTRQAILLYRFEGRKLREIAEELGISVGRVHGLVAEGLEHCRKHLYPSE